MFWHQKQPIAQSIFMNFQNLIADCIQNTSPDKNYFFEKNGDDFCYASQIPFPLMNGIISNAYEPMAIDAKCKMIKERFKGSGYPITWLWLHDMALPQDVEYIFTKNGFSSMGEYTSIAVESNHIRNLPIQLNKGVMINLVENDKQFDEFLQITKNVYGMTNDALPGMARLYSAYKYSNNMKLFLAVVDKIPVSTLFSYQFQSTLGLYNGATLGPYRNQGLLTAMMIHAVKNATQIEYVVAQLMSCAMAKGVCDQLGFEEHAHFIPLCYGFDFAGMHA